MKPSGEAIRDLVEKLVENPSVRTLGVDEPIQGLVDSFALIELLGMLEKQYAIRFRNEHMARENWRSFAAIAGLVSVMVESRAGEGERAPGTAP